MRKGDFEFSYSDSSKRYEIVCWQVNYGRPTCYTVCYFIKGTERYDMITVGNRLVSNDGDETDLWALIKYAFAVLEAEFVLNEE